MVGTDGSENAQAATTTKAGFTNSDGWTPMPPSMIHRWAPLISGPNGNASKISTIPMA